MKQRLAISIALLSLAVGTLGAAFAEGGSTPVYLPLLLRTGPPWTRVTFDRYPDGTLVIEDTILSGDEFAAKGIMLAGSPEPSYCADATAAAILVPPHHVGAIDFTFLTSSYPDTLGCHAVPVEIRFIHPVRAVRLLFAGVSATYTLEAYDSVGGIVGTAFQEAVWGGGVFRAEYVSASANISRVTFGRAASTTAIKELLFVR